ncbi:hypothetical protein DSBG_0569 [Desulfosporosinus sp. BG]|nr:hypothetical protein DSBG_0569 [Desulfosporosinus sp. BG]
MTLFQKDQVRRLRSEGKSYLKIAVPWHIRKYHKILLPKK